MRQALRLQELCVAACERLGTDVNLSESRDERARSGTALGNLARNWTALQDTVRVLKGDPLPGSLKPEPKAKRRQHVTLNLEAAAKELGIASAA